MEKFLDRVVRMLHTGESRKTLVANALQARHASTVLDAIKDIDQ